MEVLATDIEARLTVALVAGDVVVALLTEAVLVTDLAVTSAAVMV